MKRKLRIFIGCFAAILFAVSCAGPSDHPEVADTANDYFLNDTLTRSAFLAFPEAEQMALYRRLAPEMKARLWKSKTEDVLNHWPLTRRERKQIQKLDRMITPAFYEKSVLRQGTPPGIISIEHELLRCGWSEARLFLTLETFETLSELRRDYPSMNEAFRSECEKDPYLRDLLDQ